jgi:hypothetical protein
MIEKEKGSDLTDDTTVACFCKEIFQTEILILLPL